MAVLVLSKIRFRIENVFKFAYLSQRLINDDCQSQCESRITKNVSKQQNDEVNSRFLCGNDEQVLRTLTTDMLVYDNFLSTEEENSLLAELEPYLKKMRYEYDHWDNAIHGFRETERLHWSKANECILQRIRNLAFPPSVAQLKHVHVLDLSKDGYIKPHVDSVRFCGDTIAGLSLLSSCVMKLVREENKDKIADVLLPRRSLYIMRHSARYDYTHEILSGEKSIFKGKHVPRDRRISIICRNEPS